MGVNATGTLGVAGRAPKMRESRRRRRQGVWDWGGAVPLLRKFMNFSYQNGVIWCILGVLFLRFTCPMDCSCMINFIEVPEVKHLSKYWGSVNTGRPLQVKYWGVATPATPAALHRMCLTFRGLCVLGTRPRCAKTDEPIVWWFWEGRHVWPDPRNHIFNRVQIAHGKGHY